MEAKEGTPPPPPYELERHDNSNPCIHSPFFGSTSTTNRQDRDTTAPVTEFIATWAPLSVHGRDRTVESPVGDAFPEPTVVVAMVLWLEVHLLQHWSDTIQPQPEWCADGK